MTTLIGLDLNTTRARAIQGESHGSGLHVPIALPLDGNEREMLLAVSLEERHPRVGRAGAGQDAGRGGELVLGGAQEDGEADPVHVQAGLGGGGVGGGADERLVGGQQGPGFLVDALQAAGAQHPAIEQGGL